MEWDVVRCNSFQEEKGKWSRLRPRRSASDLMASGNTEIGHNRTQTTNMLGIISDIHGHLLGLEVILEVLAKHEVTKIICLGDLVDGGENSLDVVRKIQELQIECVRGNHDVYNNENLPTDYQEWLNRLPDSLICNDCLFTHISPRRIRVSKINDEVEAWNVFGETTARRIFIGHTHLSLIFGEKSDSPVQSSIIPFKFGDWIQLDQDDRYIISPGAIGYSRDGRNTMRCAIYDPNGDQIQILEVSGSQIA